MQIARKILKNSISDTISKLRLFPLIDLYFNFNPNLDIRFKFETGFIIILMKYIDISILF